MLSQVWNIEYVECPTPLEAALLETDEIKRLNPPYNVYLKNNRSDSVFYTKTFSSSTTKQDANHSLGPFRPNSAVESLRTFSTGLVGEKVLPVFFEEIPEDLLTEGFSMFCGECTVNPDQLKSVRQSLAIGMRLLREFLKSENEEESLTEASDEIKEGSTLLPEMTAEDIAKKFRRLFIRSASEYRRSRKLTRLLNSDIEWKENGHIFSLALRNGKIYGDDQTSEKNAPWAHLELGDYDRMSVLLSEIEKHPHRIFPKSRADQCIEF